MRLVLRHLRRAALAALLVLASLGTHAGIASAQQPAPPAASSVSPSVLIDTTRWDHTLRAELLRRAALDQQVREGLTPERIADTAFVGRLMAVDADNTAWLAGLLRARGWPVVSMVGTEGSGAAWLLLQHAPGDVQVQWYATVAALPPGEVRPQDLALLTDRVRGVQGRPQVYGSQFSIVGGRMVPKPIEDPAHVDERRARVGLPPMADYVRMLQEMYHMPVQAP